MAKSRAEVLGAIMARGLTQEEADEELRHREAEAQRLIDAAHPHELADVLRRAKALLRMDQPLFVRPTTTATTRKKPGLLPATLPAGELAPGVPTASKLRLRALVQPLQSFVRSRAALPKRRLAVALACGALAVSAAVYLASIGGSADGAKPGSGYMAEVLGTRIEAALAAAQPLPPAAPYVPAAPQFEVVRTLTKKRLDGGKNLYLLIPPVDLSNANFKEDIKLLVRDLVAQNGPKVTIEIHDEQASLDGSYKRFGEKSISRAITEQEQANEALHFIATFSGSLETGMFFNTLQFFTAANATHPVVGQYIEDLDFDPAPPPPPPPPPPPEASPALEPPPAPEELPPP